MTAKTILITNEKGGVGKTTTAVHLAVGLSYALMRKSPKGDRRVLLIDTDPQGCVSTNLDIDPGDRCLSQLLLETQQYNEVIVRVSDFNQAAGDGRPNLFVLPSTRRLSSALEHMAQDYGAMVEIANRLSPGARKQMGAENIPTISDTFERVIAPLRQSFDYIIVDSAPGIGLLEEALYRFCDHVIVPTEAKYHDVAQTMKHTQSILEWQQHGARARLLVVLPTQFDDRTNLGKQMYDELMTTYPRAVADPIPARTAIASGPALGGLTIFEYQPKSDGAMAYGRLVKRVLAV